MRREYPPFGTSDASINNWMQFITNERKIDLNDFNNLPQRFIEGRLRKNRLLPTSSTDVSVEQGDQPGDVIISSNHVYFLVDVGGNTFNWKRTALTSF